MFGFAVGRIDSTNLIKLKSVKYKVIYV